MIAATSYDWPWYGIAIDGLCGVAACIGVVVCLINIRRARKERRRGKHRQTSTHSPGTQTVGKTAVVTESAGEAAREDPDAGLEVIEEDTPILAHRAARLVTGRGALTFAALHASHPYGGGAVRFGVDADAFCRCYSYSYRSMYQDWANHRPVPSLNGDCGFYAVPADVESQHGDDPGIVDLLVELSGRVIEHEQGYRAEHQRVIEMRVPRCSYCSAPSDRFLFLNGILARVGCGKHLDTHTESKDAYCILSRSDLVSGCPVPVTDEPR